MIEVSIYKKLNGVSGDLNLNIELQISKGEFITLYGNSGVGKTSILQMLSGLMRPDSGKIVVDGEVWFDSKQKINLKPQERNIGYVFQDYALFPNMTVRQNLEFALHKTDDTAIVTELMKVVELEALENKYSKTLSGGQQQRVALARALVQSPKLLLLDEPLSALDISIRSKLQDYLLEVHHKYQLTTMLVSHDIGEVIKLSDKVFILDEGKIVKQGIPIEIFTDEKTNQNNIQVSGVILAIDSDKIRISVGSQVHIIKVSEDEISSFKVGDSIVLTSELLNPKLYKIEPK